MKKILWIDDEEDLIDANIPVFHKHGLYVFKATNTSQALRILREEQVDGVLLDVRLHGNESGIDLLQELSHQYPTLKIVIFTGYRDDNDHLQAEKSGAAIYLEKIDKSIPLDPEKQKIFFQVLHDAFPKIRSSSSETMKGANHGVPVNRRLWITGLFFLFALLIIFGGIAMLSRIFAPLVLSIVLIAAILLYMIVGAFILRMQGDNYLSQKNFLTLMLKTLNMLPLLRRRIDESEDKEEDRDI